jgi:hypothetical protein
LLDACLLCATFTCATCSLVVPYSYMWRMNEGANDCAAEWMPWMLVSSDSPRNTGVCRPVPPMRAPV